jgi:hypothetical protein
MSMRSTRSDLKGSRFPLKLGLPPAPQWKRRTPAAPGPGSGDRVRRSEQADADATKLGEMAHSHGDKDT